MSDLPRRTVEYLEHGASEGQRNAELFEAACQIRDAGFGVDRAEQELIDRAMMDGLTEHEALSTIRSAFRGPARKPIGDGGGNGNQFPHHSYVFKGRRNPVEFIPGAQNKPVYDLTKKHILPQPIPDGARRLLREAFLEGEGVRLVLGSFKEEGKDSPASKGNVFSREEWLRKLDDVGGQPNRLMMGEGNPGIFVAINPIRNGGSTDRDVTAFRHALLEWDNLPLEDQYTLIVNSKLPCSAVIYTGGKSIHAWVRLDAKDANQFKERVAYLWEHFSEYGNDQQNANPSRTSRLPNCARGEARQELLAVNIGYSTWDEWVQGVEDAKLPEKFDIDEIADFDPNSDPDSVLGKRWLCRKAVAIIQGQAGTGKSSLVAQMAVSWAWGIPFFGIKPTYRPLKVMLIQAENDKGDISEMFQGVCDKLERPLNNADGTPNHDNRDYLREHVSIYKESIRTSQAFIATAKRLIEKEKPDIVFCDPLLTYVGDDVSKQVVVSKFLRTWLQPIIEETGVVWIFIHHTGKPSTDPKSKSHWTEADMSYSGFGSSELANMPRASMTLMRVAKSDGVFVFTLSKRTDSGMCDGEGNLTQTIYLKQCRERRANGTKIIFWERSDYDPKAGKDTTKAEREERERKEKGGVTPALDEISQEEFLTTVVGEYFSKKQLAKRLIDFAKRYHEIDVSVRTAEYWLKKSALIEQFDVDPETKTYVYRL